MSETAPGTEAKSLASIAKASVVVGVVLAGWLASRDVNAIRDTLRWLSPRAIELAFLLMVGGAVASFGAIRSSLADRRLAPMGAVGLFALVTVAWLPPATHRIYYDEDIYQNVAQNLVWSGRAQMCNEGEIVAGGYRCLAHEYNKEPNGFPFLLSLGFRLGGVDEAVSHRVNHVVFALGAMAVYWLGCLLFRDSLAAVAAALVYTLTPQSLLWGGTVAAEPSAAATTAAALGAWVLFCREGSFATGIFAGSALAFAAQFRPESGLVLVAAALFMLLLARERIRRRETLAVALIVAGLLVPHFAHLWAVRGESWGAVDGGKFTWSVVRGNLRTNAGYHVFGEDFPALYTLLAFLGLLSSRRRREAAALLGWFVLFFGVFIPFYAGSYRYGADVRFSLLSAAPLALLAGLGVASVAGLLERKLAIGRLFAEAALCLLVVYAFSAFLPLVRAVGAEAELARADHDTALEMVDRVPPGSIVLTHNPGMLQVMGQTSAQTSLATYQPQRMAELFRRFPGGVYFHFNFWCNVDDEAQKQFCSNVLSAHGTEVVMDERAGIYRYVLYRVLP